MRQRLFPVCLMAALLAPNALSQSFLSQYKGLPFHDTHYQAGAQKIPGRVFCAYYDFGGEGVAYHDVDPKNHGSGELNPADGTYLNEFRIHEGVDTSYTKFNRKPDPVDDNPFNKIVPPADLPYVGWTNQESGSTSRWMRQTPGHIQPIYCTRRIAVGRYQSM